MEIRLKTAEEFHAAHVTIEIRATPEEATEVSQRLFTADEVGHYQATEARLVADPLRRRIGELERTLAREVNRNTDLEAELEKATRGHVCTDGCKPNAHVAFIGRQRLAELEIEVADEAERADKAETALIKVRAEREELDEKLARERELTERLAKTANEAEMTVARERAAARQSTAARDHLLSAATTRMNAVREILLATAVSRARDEIVTTKGAVLADAIGNALHALEG